MTVKLTHAATSLLLALAGVACSSSKPLRSPDAAPPTGAAGGAAGASGAGDGSGEVGTTPAAGANGDGGVADDGGATGDRGAALDPGWVGIRLLSNTEYARTLQDLLGLSGLDDQIVAGLAPTGDDRFGTFGFFDNLADGPAIVDVRFQRYFDTAVAFVDQAFASPSSRALILTCAPSAPTDETCARAVIRAFGLRAWRRPLTAVEVDSLAALARGAGAAGGDFVEAMRQVVVALLVSESFLYRIELDPPSVGTPAHALTSYELASRLSYLLWSTMPDATLFQLAATDDLQKKETLAAQVTRMLADARSDGFVRSFFGQWLGFRGLDGPSIDYAATGWSAALQASMAEEARLFVTAIVQENRSIGELLTADVNFLDDNLANLYRLSRQGPLGSFVRVEDMTDFRKGYLGLGATLTLTSPATRTSATSRGKWVLERLLCIQVPAPPPNEPPPLPTANAREQFDALAQMPACAGCHKLTDLIGLGLEHFDQIGRFRLTYEPGAVPIDTHGALPDGTPFDGLVGLANLLGKDPRFAACAAREALTYALGRRLTASDDDRLASLGARWSAAGGTVRTLLAAVVTDDMFRFRRAEGP